MAADVQAVKMAILRFAHVHDVDSAVLVQAMAEVTGMVAAQLDRDIGLQTFDERMASFAEHARAHYLRGPTMLAR
jgi:hypothetical protein